MGGKNMDKNMNEQIEVKELDFTKEFSEIEFSDVPASAGLGTSSCCNVTCK